MALKHTNRKERANELQEYLRFLYGYQEDNKKLILHFRLIKDRDGDYPTNLMVPYSELKFDSISNVYGYHFSKKNGSIYKKKLQNGKYKKSYIATMNHPDKVEDDGYGVFLTINSGGTESSEINIIRSLYWDFDFGKEIYTFDNEKDAALFALKECKKSDNEPFNREKDLKPFRKQFKLEIRKTYSFIKKKKKEFFQELEETLGEFLVIETRNGFHVYLLVEEDKKLLDKDTFIAYSIAIEFKFKGFSKYIDRKVYDKPRVLRLPGFYHMKDEPFMVRIAKRPSAKERHNIDDFLSKYNIKPVIKKSAKRTRVIDGEERHTEIIPATTKLMLTDDLGYEKREMTKSEFTKFVKQIPISHFFENEELKKQSFCCFFHNDKKPSASISYLEEKQIYYYRCFGSCEIHAKDIIKLVKEVENCKTATAYHKLSKICNVEIVETEFEKGQKEKYFEDNQFLGRIYDMIEEGEISESLKKIIATKGRLRLLDAMIKVASNVVIKDEYQHEGEAIFFTSLRYLMKLVIGKDIKEVDRVREIHQNVKILTLLGFIRRIPTESLPEDLRNTSEKMRKENEEAKRSVNDSEIEHIINYYSLPNFYDAVDVAEQRAALLATKKFTFKHHLNKTSLIKLFGSELANEVFPDERTIPEWQEKLSEQLVKRIRDTIIQQGYILESAVLKTEGLKIKIFNKEKGIYVRRRPTKVEIESVYKKLVEPEQSEFILVLINKERREKFNLSLKGRIKIWIQNEEG